MPGTLARLLVLVLLSAFLVQRGEAYVGRCASCGTVSDVDRFEYAATPGATKTGAFVAPEAADRRGASRGTRIEIRMDKGGKRVVHVHGDPRIYKGDRVRLYRDRIELL